MIAAARACIGTPFHHQGRRPGAGLDCIGLIVIALRAAGFPCRTAPITGAGRTAKASLRRSKRMVLWQENEIEAGIFCFSAMTASRNMRRWRRAPTA